MAKHQKPKPPQGKPKPAPVSDEVLQSLLKPKSPPHPEPRDSATGVYVVAAIIIVCAVLAIWGMVY